MKTSTKAVLSVAILGVGGYLLWKNWKVVYPAAAAPAAASANASTAPAGFTGDAGKRVKFAGATGPVRRKHKRNLTDPLHVQNSGWIRGKLNADGTSNAGLNFFKVKGGF